MKIKIYCQSFVLPYLEATGQTQDFQFHTTNQYTDFLQKAFQDLSPQTTTKTQRYNKYMLKYNQRIYKQNTYTTHITIDIDPAIIPNSITDLIETISIVQYDFCQKIKKELFAHFYALMIREYISNQKKITQVIQQFYIVFDLDEDTLISENLRTHWRRTKPYKSGGRELFRNQLLSTQHLSHPTAQTN